MGEGSIIKNIYKNPRIFRYLSILSLKFNTVLQTKRTAVYFATLIYDSVGKMVFRKTVKNLGIFVFCILPHTAKVIEKYLNYLLTKKFCIYYIVRVIVLPVQVRQVGVARQVRLGLRAWQDHPAARAQQVCWGRAVPLDLLEWAELPAREESPGLLDSQAPAVCDVFVNDNWNCA